MKEIKYRAWDTTRKKMWSPEEMGEDELTINPDGSGFVNVHGENTKLSQYMDHLIPLQFTGLKDKAGKEIYEGDVVRNNWNGSVEAIQDIRSIDWLLSDGFLAGQENDDALLDAEIIGNIHENPELIP